MKPKSFLVGCASLCVLLLNVGADADVLDNWHWRNPSPFADNLRSICFGGGKFVTVGELGAIFTSTDGSSWNDGRRPVTQSLNRIIHVNSQFVAVGNAGVILTSPDGQTWTQQASGTTNHLMAVAYGNGRYVICGSAGQLVISTNGTSWTPASVGTHDLGWITFGNGIFVVPGGAINWMGVQTSADGLSWNTALFPSYFSALWPPQLYEVAFANGTFVAATVEELRLVPGQYTPVLRFVNSVDGTNWSKAAVAKNPFYAFSSAHRFLTAANGLFYEFTSIGNLVAATADGSSVSNTVSPDAVAGMAFGSGRYVLVGASGKVWISTDGTTWSPAYGGFRANISQIIRGASNYVAVGSSLPVLISSDGVNFTAAQGSLVQTLAGVGFDGSNYVTVGNSGVVLFSTNSTDWTPRTSNTSQNLAAICRGPSHWVAVGAAGTVITSPTTLAWTKRTSGTDNNLWGVAFGNGLYVAAGNAGTIITSSDASLWDVQYSGTTNTLVGVQFLNGQFFAVGNSGTILTSTDGLNWQTRNSGVTKALYSITYGSGRFVAAGIDFNPNFNIYQNVLLLSTNGLDWQDVTLKVPTAAGFRCVAYLDQSFWLTGDGGTILQSDSADGIPRLAGSVLPGNTGFQLRITLNAPSSYRIQARTNLSSTSWEDVASISNSVSPHVWTDTNGIGSPVKVYRIASP